MNDQPSADTNESDRTRRSLLKAAAGATAIGATGAAGCVSVTTPADTAAASEIPGNVGYFVGASWLARNREDVVVLDARDRESYRRERVYRARLVPFDRVTAQRAGDDGQSLDIETIAGAFGDIGVEPDADVLVYGGSVGSRVTRTVFALSAIGHRGDVRILNGGFSAWNGRIGTGDRERAEATSYEPNPNPELWIDREELADRVTTIAESEGGIVDVREPEAYLGAAGSKALDPSNERHGHLPGAINVNWIGNVAGRTLADPATLRSRYQDEAELDPEETIVVYGGDNVNATSTWVTLRAIGFTDVRLYDGGFGEWANAEDTGQYPVETATSVVIETEGELGGGGGGGDFSCTG